MKKYISILTLLLATSFIFAQSDDDLFGGDDDFFFDDGIEEVTIVTAQSDLAKGVLFDDGSIKIGGSFTTSLGTSTTVYADDDKDFGDHFSESTITPTVDATLSVDARPNQNLRMYTKFGFSYPGNTNLISQAGETDLSAILGDSAAFMSFVLNPGQAETYSISDWFKLKEVFTDFSIADTAFFRFGLHTVTWGAGYFYSPVSDMINTSSINPEDVDAQVDGSLNLRTQIVFPNTQNCLWFYMIPDTTKIISGTTSYAKYTALAGKADLLFGNWELGLGGLWKYENAPKAMLTATGSINKLNLFGEGVYSYGGTSEWIDNPDWDDKSHIFQATVGGMYTWKTPVITVAGQYYYDGNKCDYLMDMKYGIESIMPGMSFSSTGDITVPRITQGHNIAALASFGKLFGTKNINLSLFGMVNFGREKADITAEEVVKPLIDMFKNDFISAMQLDKILSAATFSAMLSYSPVDTVKLAVGPYVVFKDFDHAPTVDVKVTFTLGGGKY